MGEQAKLSDQCEGSQENRYQSSKFPTFSRKCFPDDLPGFFVIVLSVAEIAMTYVDFCKIALQKKTQREGEGEGESAVWGTVTE